MAGAFVFPGGKLDDSDSADAIIARIPSGGRTHASGRLAPTPGRTLPSPIALGLHVAAIRELFEEAGVLLAQTTGGSPPAIAESDPRFLEHRRRLAQGEAGLAEILAAEDLWLDLGALIPWAHWITPSAEPKRFDTRFFLAALPPAQHPSHDVRETTEQAWLAPAEAIAAHEEGRLFLPPPTLLNLHELRAFSSVAQALAHAEARVSRITAVLPKLTAIDQRISILMPWDPRYAETEGEALPLSGTHPMEVEISRVELDGERWIARRGG